MFHEITEDRPVVIVGDGRSDSPGHSAKYGSYTFMDMDTHKILDVEIVQVSSALLGLLCMKSLHLNEVY